MATHSQRDAHERDRPSSEDESLSERMRHLLLIATVEERRKQNGRRSGPAGERRRRDDQPSEIEKHAS